MTIHRIAGRSAAWQAAAVLAVTGASCGVLFLANPAAVGLYPPCPFFALTGFYCPGCGTLRGLHQLLHGNVVSALDFNPFMVVMLPFVSYGIVSFILGGLTGRSLPRVFVPPFWIRALLVSVVLFWVLRNVPIFPLSLLAP